jgi:hypothetical protein
MAVIRLSPQTNGLSNRVSATGRADQHGRSQANESQCFRNESKSRWLLVVYQVFDSTAESSYLCVVASDHVDRNALGVGPNLYHPYPPRPGGQQACHFAGEVRELRFKIQAAL